MDAKPVILVVDDDAPITILMRTLLREFGFEPVTAMSGSEAIEAAREHPPNLILLDKHMPGMACADIVAALRAADGGEKTPILILSGDPCTAAEIAALGANGAVQKPFDVQGLVRQIRDYLAGR
jgi:DNA-binding response OmpR family regulator